MFAFLAKKVLWIANIIGNSQIVRSWVGDLLYMYIYIHIISKCLFDKQCDMFDTFGIDSCDLLTYR